MILDTIQSQIQDAMRARDTFRTETLKLLYSSLKYEKIAKMHDLSEDEEMAVVGKEIKKRSDAIAAYQKANAPDRAAKEEAERTILREFLPPLMSEEELTTIVKSVITEEGATEMKDMGKVISSVQGKVGFHAESPTIAKIAHQELMK